MTRVDICICTFRRPSVAAAIRSVAAQRLTPGGVLRIIVADNDDEPTARGLVEGVAAGCAVPVIYLHAPARNISVARNACLAASDGDWTGFLDDDETAPPDWVAKLVDCALGEGADVVFGPALAVYPKGTAGWIVANDFHSNRPQRRHGRVETGHSCNVLMRRSAVEGMAFNPRLGRSGGEDTDFFFRLHRRGLRLAICEAAAVHETVPPQRVRLGWLIERRLAEGQHYAMSAGRARIDLAGRSLAKAGYCILRAAGAGQRARLAFWALRAVFHLGVLRGALRPSRRDAYGR